MFAAFKQKIVSVLRLPALILLIPGSLLTGCGSEAQRDGRVGLQPVSIAQESLVQTKMADTASWSVVTTSSAGDGYVLYGDQTYQWLAAECMNAIRQQELPINSIEWAQISEQTQLSGVGDCEMVRTALTDQSDGSGGVFPNTPWRVVSTGGSDGYVLYQSGNRHWLSESCMNQLKAAEITVLRQDWYEISEMPQLAGEGDCDAVEQTLGDPVSRPLWRIVTTTDAGDGYALYPGNTRYWLSASCINRIRRDGITVLQVPWSQVSNYQQVGVGQCSDFVNTFTRIERNEFGAAVVTTTDNGDGYLLWPVDTRSWLSAQCIESLRDDQLTISAVQWDDISEMREESPADCNFARRLLGGEDLPTALDLFLMEQLDLTFEQLRHYQRLQAEVYEHSFAIVSQLGDAYAGSYFDRGDDGFHIYVVAVSDNRDVTAVDGFLPVVKRVKYSLTELEALQTRIQSIVPFGPDMDVWSSGIDIPENAISLGAGIGASEPVRRLLDQFSFPQDAVIIEESEFWPNTR